MTPEIVYSIRNNAKGVNYVIAENQRFATVPADMTLEADFKGFDKTKIQRVEMTCGADSATASKKPWRMGRKLTLREGAQLFAVTAYGAIDEVLVHGARRFSVGAAVPQPEPQILITKGIASGLNQREYPVGIVAPLYREAGCTLIRNWHDMTPGKLPKSGDAANYALYAGQGFKIFTCLQIPHPFPSDQSAIDYANAFVDVYGAYVQACELLNEPNIHYWEGSFDEAVRTMRLLNKALQKRGIITCSGGVSGDTDCIGYLKKLSAAGILQEVDKVGIHAYGRKDLKKKLTASQIHNQRIEDAAQSAIANGKALWCGEDNIHAGSGAEWKEQWPLTWETTRQHVEVSCYYRGLENNQPAGSQGLLVPGTFAKNEPYFSIVKGLR